MSHVMVCVADLDAAPQEDCCTIQKLHIWQDLEEMPAHHTKELPAEFGNFINIQAFCLWHLEHNDVQGHSFEQDMMTLEALKMLYNLVLYGFFSQVSYHRDPRQEHPKDILTIMTIRQGLDNCNVYLAQLIDDRDPGEQSVRHFVSRAEAFWQSTGRELPFALWSEKNLLVLLLVQPLSLLLDCSTDAINDHEQSSHDPAAMDADEGVRTRGMRQHEEVRLRVYAECKVWVCKILDLIADIRLNIRVKKTLLVFEKDLQLGKSFGAGDDFHGTNKCVVAREDFESIFKIFDLEEKERLAPVLFALVANKAVNQPKLAHVTAAATALPLILRVLGQRAELLRTLLRGTQIILDPHLVHIYHKIMGIQGDMQHLCHDLKRCIIQYTRQREQFEHTKHLEEKKELLENAAEEDDVTSNVSDHVDPNDILRPTPGGFLQDILRQGSTEENAGGVFGQILGGFVGAAVNNPAPQQSDLNVAAGTGRPAAKGPRLHAAAPGTMLTSRSSRSFNAHQSSFLQRRQDSAHTKRTPAKEKRGSIVTPATRNASTDRSDDLAIRFVAAQADEDPTAKIPEIVENLIKKIDQILEVALAGHVPKYKLQNTFRNVDLHSHIIDILLAFEGEEELLDSQERVHALFSNCFSFLSHFAHGHPVNQDLLIHYLDAIVMPNLEHERVFGPAAETFAAIFCDNRMLCTKVEDDVFRSIIALLAKEQRYVYLKCLQALCCPKGIPIKRNQMSVMKYLRMNRDRKGVLELYNDKEGLEMLRHVILQEEESGSFRDPGSHGPQTHRLAWKDDRVEPPMTPRDHMAITDHGSKVMHFAHTLRLLALCCTGKNENTQRECRQWIRLKDVAAIALAEWCTVEVKTAALKFIAVVHFEGVKQNALIDAAKTEASWKLVDYINSKYRSLLEQTDVKFCYNQTTKEELDELMNLSLRVVSNFFNHCFQIAGSTEAQREAAGKMCGTLIRMYAEDTLSADTSKQIAATLSIFDRKSLSSSASERENLKTLLKSSRMVKFMVRDKTAASGRESGAAAEMVLKLFPMFLADFKTRIDIPEEYDLLCQMIERNPAAVNFLIKQLDSNHPQARASRHLYISVLKYFWISLSKQKSLQEAMAILDINALLKAIIRLTITANDSDGYGSLTLAVSLLEIGGRVMQDKFYKELIKKPSYDFLAKLQQKLEAGRDEIKEMRLIVLQLVSDYSATRLGGSKPKTLPSLLKDAGMETGSESHGHSFTVVVVHFLHVLCRGQHANLQKLIGGSVHDLNLTLEVAQLVSDMEKCVDPMNIDKAIKGFQTLTCLLQGPCRLNQMALVRRTPIIRVISTLIKSPLRNPSLNYSREYTLLVWDLKSALADCLLGLLEGVSYTDPFIAQRMMQDLDCAHICNYIVQLHNDRTRMDAKCECVAFQFFLLLRTLDDYASDPESSPLQHLEKNSHVYSYFHSQTGSIEIAQGVQLVRFYFREPEICKGISERNKELLLWNVNRESEMSRLADFFERIGDIYKEMKFRLLRVARRFADRLYMWIVTLLNILLLVFFKYIEPPDADPERPLWVRVIPSEPAVPLLEIDGTVKILVKDILSVAQLLLELTMLMSHLVEDTPNFVRKYIKHDISTPFSFLDAGEQAHQAVKTKMNGKLLEASRGFYLVVRYCFFALHDSALVWRLIACFITLVIVATTDDHTLLQLLLFAALLLEVFQRSKAIGFVATAVLKGGWVLLLTVGMGLVFLYWFAVVGFVFFPNLFQFRKAEVVDGSTQDPWDNDRRVPCVNVWTCFLIILDQGLRKEDVGEALDKLPWPTLTNAEGECEVCTWDQVGKTCAMLNKCEGLWSWPQGKLWIRIAYTFFFFVLISAVCLEVIFGIIIDSFKSIREEREEIQKDINKKCFMCGISRDLFDSRAAGGFEQHCREEHNMWVYMKFLIHLREKKETECNGLEHYVLHKCRARDFSFFPVGRAFSLGGHRNQNHKDRKSDVEGQVQHFEMMAKLTRDTVLRKVLKAKKQFGEPTGETAQSGTAEVLNVVKEAANREKILAGYSLE